MIGLLVLTPALEEAELLTIQFRTKVEHDVRRG
jgi:hypothetical protein